MPAKKPPSRGGFRVGRRNYITLIRLFVRVSPLTTSSDVISEVYYFAVLKARKQPPSGETSDLYIPR